MSSNAQVDGAAEVFQSPTATAVDPEMQHQHSVGLKQRRSQRKDAAVRNGSFCTVASDGNALTRSQSELRARRGREVDDEMPTSGRIAMRASTFAAHHPCKAFSSCFSIILAITMVGALSGELAFSEEGSKDWHVMNSIHSESRDAIELAEGKVDCIPVNGTCPQLPIRSQSSKGVLGYSIIYESDDASGGMFIPERLQQACRVEKIFLDNKYYPKFCALRPGAASRATAEGRELNASDCQEQTTSVVQLFYESGGASATSCELLSSDDVSATKQRLLEMLQDPAQKLQAGFYIGADIAGPLGRPFLGRTRSLLGLGYPLEGHESVGPKSTDLQLATQEFWEQLESDMLEHFGKSHSRTRTAYWEEWKSDDVEFLFTSMALQDLETARVVTSDMGWLLVSIAFVWACLIWRTTSVFVGTVSLLQILFSVPVAFFFYRFIFQITYFQQLHGILIFIMLGIGADAVFVFSDAWQQSAEILSGAGSSDAVADEEVKDLTARLALAYQRTMVSVFNTSFTTAVAFLATAISPIMPIRTMGIFACLLVLTNYVFVITLTPSVVAVWQTYRVNLSRCCCCCQQRKAAHGEPSHNSAPDVVEQASEERSLEQTQSSSLVEGCFLSVFGRPSVAALSLLLFAIFGGLNCYWAAQLEPPPEMFMFFGKEHMHTKVRDLSGNGFLAGGDDDYLILQVTFGVQGVDRSPNSSASVDPWAPHLFYGVPEWDGGFDLSQPDTQEFLRGFCERIRSASCTSDGCSDGLLVQPGPNSVSCFIEEFDDWAGGSTFEGEEFLSKLQAFRNTQRPRQIFNNQATWEKGIGFVGGTLNYVQIQAMLTLKKMQPGSIREVVLETVMNMLAKEQARAPAGAGTLLQTVGLDWTFLVLEQELVSGLFSGFAICFPTAFIVLLLSTQNVLVAFYAILTIGAIVLSVLGWCWRVEGWYLGVTESIAGIIVIGLAVDYVIHLGHMYLEVGHLGYETRAERWRMALKSMGVTVLAGAVTTLVAGLSMRFCQMTFFLQMSTLISVTIAYSLLFTLFFFMCLLRVAGPERERGDISGPLRRACGAVSCRKRVGGPDAGSTESLPPANMRHATMA